MNAREKRGRRARALELHLEEKSYAEIASELGYASPSGAHQAVKAELKARELDEVASKVAVEGIPEMELERIDAMLKGLWPKAQDGDAGAVDRVLRLEDRRLACLRRSGLVEAVAEEAEKAAEESGEVTPLSELQRRREERDSTRSRRTSS